MSTSAGDILNMGHGTMVLIGAVVKGLVGKRLVYRGLVSLPGMVVRPVRDEGHDCVGIEGQRPPSAPSGVLTCEGRVPGSLFLSRARRLWVAGNLDVADGVVR